MRLSALTVFVAPQQPELDQLQEKLRSMRKQVMRMTVDLEELNVAIWSVEQEYQLRLSRVYRELEETELSTQQFQLRLRLAREGVEIGTIENRVVDCFKSRWERLDNLYSPDPNATNTKSGSTSSEPFNNSQQEQLQQVYHQLAKSFHPDKASMNLPDSEMMVRINRAYETNDLKTLLRIQEGSADIASMDKSESVIVQKKRIEWSIRRTKRFIGDLTIEISRVKSSEGYRLKTTFDDCQKNGKDLFTDLVKDVQRKTNRAKQHLQELKQKFNRILSIKRRVEE